MACSLTTSTGRWSLPSGAPFGKALELLQRLGAEIRELSLPTYDVVRGRRAVFVRVEVEAAADAGRSSTAASPTASRRRCAAISIGA